MAIDLSVTYPGKVDLSDLVGWPQGRPKNESAAGANDGTPVEEAFHSDVSGFLQAILRRGGIVPSGDPDNAGVGSSQYIDGLWQLIGAPFGYRGPGARMFWNTPTSIKVTRGEIAGDIIFPGPGDEPRVIAVPPSVQRTITAAWTDPSNVTAMVAAELPLTTDKWYAVWAYGNNDPNIDATIVFSGEGSSTAQLLADSALIAEGYTNARLIRRIGWVLWDGAAIPEFHSVAGDPHSYEWDVPFADVDVTGGSVPDTVARTEFPLTHVPNECYANVAIVENGKHLLITRKSQTDTLPTSTIFTISRISANDDSSIGRFFAQALTSPTGSFNGSIYARRDSVAMTEFRVCVHGWTDLGDD